MKRPIEAETTKFHGLNNSQKNQFIEDLNKYIDYLESKIKEREILEGFVRWMNFNYHAPFPLTIDEYLKQPKTHDSREVFNG